MSYHISITGHRPGRLKGGYDLESVENQQLLCEMIAELEEQLSKHKHITIHTGMALGVDTLFALAGIALKTKYPEKVSLTAEIPCNGQESRWNEEDRQLYQELLTYMDTKTIYQHHYTRSCMFERNTGMVKASDLVYAVYDGSGKGGTYHAIKTAERLNKPIHYFNPDTYLR